MKFRKKPVVIEAMQLTWENWSPICDFVHGPAFGGGCYIDADGKETADSNGRLGLRIVTLEGVMLATENDWVIKGVKGEFYPCKPDIFAATYEAVDATTAVTAPQRSSDGRPARATRTRTA